MTMLRAEVITSVYGGAGMRLSLAAGVDRDVEAEVLRRAGALGRDDPGSEGRAV